MHPVYYNPRLATLTMTVRSESTFHYKMKHEVAKEIVFALQKACSL